METEVSRSESELSLRAKMLETLLRESSSKSNQIETFEILIVEDNYFDYQLLLTALEASDIKFKSRWVKDGNEAIDYLLREGVYKEASKPNIVLLDLYMAGMDGLTTLRKIRKYSDLDDLVIVMHSNSHADKDLELAYESGANSYLHKTADFRKLVTRLKNIAWYWFKFIKVPKLTL